MPYNSYRFSCEHVQLKRLSFLSKLSIILNCHSKKRPFHSMGEGILCQTAAGLATHTCAHSCTRMAPTPTAPTPACPAQCGGATMGRSLCGFKSWLWGLLVFSELMLFGLCSILQGPAHLGQVGPWGGCPHRFLGAAPNTRVAAEVLGLG